jgi:hypothetical protein
MQLSLTLLLINIIGLHFSSANKKINKQLIKLTVYKIFHNLTLTMFILHQTNILSFVYLL